MFPKPHSPLPLEGQFTEILSVVLPEKFNKKNSLLKNKVQKTFQVTRFLRALYKEASAKINIPNALDDTRVIAIRIMQVPQFE